MKSSISFPLVETIPDFRHATKRFDSLIHLRGIKVHRRRLLRAFCAGGLCVLAFAILQLTLPGPDSRHMGDGAGALAEVHAGSGGRKVAFDGGRKVFAVEELPHLGLPGAKHVMVEYFDYQCPACRRMHFFVQSLLRKHPSELCLIVLPVPLNSACNHRQPSGEPEHPGACGVARVAMAVWRAAPGRFPTLHESFLKDPPMDEQAAILRASSAALPSARLVETMADSWIGRLLAANIEDWNALSADRRMLPKVWIRDRRILHGLPTGELDFISAIEKELDLAP